MTEALFIGGPLDGRRQDVAKNKTEIVYPVHTVTVPIGPACTAATKIETTKIHYTRTTYQVGYQTAHIFTLIGMTNAETVMALIDGYNPTVKAEVTDG